MARRLPKDVAWVEVVLEVEDRWCGKCGRRLHVCAHRRRRIFTFDGPRLLICKLAHCPDGTCPNHGHMISPEREAHLSMPRWMIGWDVFCWLGHRRFARHWSVPQLRLELLDSYHIVLSEDAIEDGIHLQSQSAMLAVSLAAIKMYPNFPHSTTIYFKVLVPLVAKIGRDCHFLAAHARFFTASN